MEGRGCRGKQGHRHISALFWFNFYLFICLFIFSSALGLFAAQRAASSSRTAPGRGVAVSRCPSEHFPDVRDETASGNAGLLPRRAPQGRRELRQ